MNSLIIGGSKIDVANSGVSGVYDANIRCSLCGNELIKEIWVNYSTRVMPVPNKYVRIVFGVHPEIHSKHQGPVPAVYTGAYFCKTCEDHYHIVSLLLLEFLPNIHPLHPADNQFNPELGCWITIWPLDKQSQPSWPLNYQVSLPFFQKLAKNLLSFPENPFNVFQT